MVYILFEIATPQLPDRRALPRRSLGEGGTPIRQYVR